MMLRDYCGVSLNKVGKIIRHVVDEEDDKEMKKASEAYRGGHEKIKKIFL